MNNLLVDKLLVEYSHEEVSSYLSRIQEYGQCLQSSNEPFHESKQTFRDFINSINYSHDKTIIIIDDVYPNDIFSSLMNNPIGFRKLNNPLNNDNSWHGDVFKTIFLIHDLCPQYSYCTIDWPDGNPQTICYKSPRKNFRPFFTSLEAIDRTTYLDLIGNLSLLNLTSEQMAIEEVRSFIEN